MVKKELIGYVVEKSNIKSGELIEKDIILHSILIELSKDKHFRKNFAFKGGTCLIKCYLGYYRFSEDLDFSWANQKLFKNKSGKQVRKELSSETSKLLELLKRTSDKLELEFETDKQNKKYVEFGGSNKFITFKLWYDSIILKTKQFIKIQINFIELFLYKTKKLHAKSLIKTDEKELKFLFPEYCHLSLNPVIKSYDIREILLEKTRAILTRRGLKLRDFIDVFLIAKEIKKDIAHFEKEAIEKTRFMLKYEKYLQNLKEKKHIRLDIRAGDEQKLIIKPLDAGFDKFLAKFLPFLNKIAQSLTKKEDKKI